MSNRIHYDQQFNLSRMLAQAVHAVLEARVAAIRVQSVLDSIQTGTTPDWAALVIELGLIDKQNYPALQQAQDLYTIFSNVTNRLDNDSIRRELARLDQG